jgi:hypothetical protein
MDKIDVNLGMRRTGPGMTFYGGLTVVRLGWNGPEPEVRSSLCSRSHYMCKYDFLVPAEYLHRFLIHNSLTPAENPKPH